MAEEGSCGAPLPAPACTFRGQDSIAERVREDAPFERRLGKALVLVEEDAFDQRGVGDPNHTRGAGPVDHQRLLVDLLRQGAQRIVDEAQEKARKRQGFRRRHNARRIESGFSGQCVGHVATCNCSLPSVLASPAVCNPQAMIVAWISERAARRPIPAPGMRRPRRTRRRRWR